MKTFKELRYNLNESAKNEKEMRRRAEIDDHLEGELDPEGGVDETGTAYRTVKKSPNINKLRQFIKNIKNNPLRKKLLNKKTIGIAGLVAALTSTVPAEMIGKQGNDISKNIAKISVQMNKEAGEKDEEEMLRRALGLGEGALLSFAAYTHINEGLFSTLSGAFRTAFDKIYDDPLKPIDPPKEHKPTERPSSVKVNSVKARTRNRLSKKYK